MRELGALKKKKRKEDEVGEEDEGLLIVRTKVQDPVFFSLFFFFLLLLVNKQLNARGQQPRCKACQDLPAPEAICEQNSNFITLSLNQFHSSIVC